MKVCRLINSVHDKQIELTDAELKQIYNLACEAYKGITRYSEEEYVTHPINVAIILTEIEAGPNEILAGLLCDVQTKGDYSAISERLTPELRLLVEKLNDGLSEDIQLIKQTGEAFLFALIISLIEKVKQRKEKTTSRIRQYQDT